MEHLSAETLARLVGELPAPEQRDHLEACDACAAELDALLTKLGMEPVEVMRTKDDLYKELGLAGKTLSRAEGIRLLVEHPALLERPIVVKGDKAVVARPPEKVSELL